MLRTFALIVVLVSTTTVSTQSASALTVGGWSGLRGGDSGIFAGDDFAAVRKDLAAHFPGATLAASDTLTSTFLSSIDVLAISPVFGGESVTSAPLTVAEQTALTTWVSGGGRALIIGENFNYYAASQSMIGPFGPQWKSTSNFGVVTGTITDHTSFPTITNGPFGVVNTFSAGYDAYFENVSPATPFGTSDDTNGVILAAMDFGSGKVVFNGSNSFLYGLTAGHDPGNDTLRRNTLAYLLNATPRNQYDYNSNGAVDAADFVLWRKTFGQTGPNLRADGNLNAEVDLGDYDLWRGHFGDTAVIGSGTDFSNRPIPEPASIVLIITAMCVFSATHNHRRTRSQYAA